MATRQIKDAKDLSTNELIYFKGHAQATYMSDGRTVEEAVNSMSGGGASSGNITAIPYDGSELDSRNIMDAIDSTTGEKVYFTGDANYIRCNGGMLIDYIDDKAAAAKIIKWDVEAGLVDYVPDEALNWIGTQEGVLILNGGVAIMVLNEELGLPHVQSSVVKDNTIFVTKVFLTMFGYDSDSVTIDTSNLVTSVKIDGVSKTPSSGVVDLGYVNKKLTTSTSSAMTLSPNIYYRNTNTSISRLSITLGVGSNSNIINEYFVEFTTSSSGTTVLLPASIKWANGVTPTFENGKTYQISIVNNLGTCVKFG